MEKRCLKGDRANEELCNQNVSAHVSAERCREVFLLVEVVVDEVALCAVVEVAVALEEAAVSQTLVKRQVQQLVCEGKLSQLKSSPDLLEFCRVAPNQEREQKCLLVLVLPITAGFLILSGSVQTFQAFRFVSPRHSVELRALCNLRGVVLCVHHWFTGGWLGGVEKQTMFCCFG